MEKTVYFYLWKTVESSLAVTHALGIAHNNGTSIMNSNRDRNKMITPQTDDVNGVKSIYK